MTLSINLSGVLLKMITDKKGSVKEKILLTAHDLFYAKGFRATGIDKIIREAQVTKVSFYRHFPAKNTLILAYLHYRHDLWITWFHDTLARKIGEENILPTALSGTLNEWLRCPSFRGCAFINATAEADSEDIAEEIKELCRNHKLDAQKTITLLTGITDKTVMSQLMMLIDGAIIHAQMGMDVTEVIEQLNVGLEKLLAD